MTSIREQAVKRIRHDHDYMVDLARRIESCCIRGPQVESCWQCVPEQQTACHANIEQLVRNFVEVTLKHTLFESMLMEDGVPEAHRIPHRQAHLNLAEQLKAVRVVFARDGRCVEAVEGIGAVLATLLRHFEEFDRQLEDYLLART
ncbi:MAG TPA: hypothetical protein PK375_02300 [Rhodocyclaceae bacterium]|nr:hypothetical protein [Rhodocyclaceae bacterium]HNH34713.1 hypothetical protein [Rhodocyclaceae bacterium]